MRKNFLPIFATTTIILERKTIFHKIDKKVVVTAPGSLMRQIAKLCDGTRPLNSVIESLSNKWDKHCVEGLIKELVALSALVDSRCLSKIVWKAVENPSHFHPSLGDKESDRLAKNARMRHVAHAKKTDKKAYKASESPLGKILSGRRSTRTFSGESVGVQALVNMVWSAYGQVYGDDKVFRLTVPSAGALYPLKIHVALLTKVGGLHPAVYEARFGNEKRVWFEPLSSNLNTFIRAFIDPIMLEGATGVVVISGSFQVTEQKYGNRSMLFVPLEVGHAAQNVHLTATENRIATLEVGGFVEKLLSEATKLPTQYQPMTTVVFGRAKNHLNVQDANSELEVNWAVPMAEKYRLPFSMAFARMRHWTGADNWSSGKSILPRLAYVKAVSEAREWAACEHVPDDLVSARFVDLETAVDPRDVVKFHPEQYRLKDFPLKPFNESAICKWTDGIDELRGRKVSLLADLVYNSFSPGDHVYARSSSSGVAAHPNREQAIINGTLELIERDSFMTAYLTKLTLPTILEKTLPQHIRKRISELRKIGFKVWVKDYSLDLAPVMFVFAQNSELSYTMCAACSNFNVEEALDHALMEVESAVLIRLANGPLPMITPRRVRTPEDHGALYEQKAFFQKSDFLASGKESLDFSKTGFGMAKTWQELLDRFSVNKLRLLTVSLHLPKQVGGNAGLHIVRSIVPGLVPISFGHRQEPCGMKRIRSLAEKMGSYSVSYRDMPKFPHPYT